MLSFGCLNGVMNRRHSKPSLLIILFGTLLPFCSVEKKLNPENILENFGQNSGIANINEVDIVFEFSGQRFDFEQRNGLFNYTRTSYPTSDSVVKDMLHNYGFRRTINDKMVSLTFEESLVFKKEILEVLRLALVPFCIQSCNEVVLTETHNFLGEDLYQITCLFYPDSILGYDNTEISYIIDKQDYKPSYLTHQIKDGAPDIFKVKNQRLHDSILIYDLVKCRSTKGDLDASELASAIQNGMLIEQHILEFEFLKH